jgi:uncharacterized membrane protein
MSLTQNPSGSYKVFVRLTKRFVDRVSQVSHEFRGLRAFSASAGIRTAIMATVTTETAARKPVAFAWLLIASGVVGLTAAFALTYEKIHLLLHPGSTPSCNFSIVVQCGKNLNSWQGSLLGFPNALLGMIGWPVVIATGVGLLAGAVYAAWYWRAFHIVATLGMLFTFWLYFESVFDLGTLCPWCMVTWVATITLAVVTKGWVLKNGIWGERPFFIRAGGWLLQWSPSVILGILLSEAIVAQLRLDWIHYL